MADMTKMTWTVMCPKWRTERHLDGPHGWALWEKVLNAIGDRYFDQAIDCIVCDCKFSLQQGVMEAFSSDNEFAIHDFQYNAEESGETVITIGRLGDVSFSEAFEDIPQIYLTPHLQPVAAVPGLVSNSGFSIFSSAQQTESGTRRIMWSARGNRGYGAIPTWRKLFSSSKGHQFRDDFRAELVDLESAFEVFVEQYLVKSLKGRLRDETVDWILKHSIDEILSIGFTELKGIPLSELEREAHGKWKRHAKELRDSVVHRGVPVTQDQAEQARRAVFDLVTRVDPKALDHFQIMRKLKELNGPSVTFGQAVVKAGTQKVQVGHGLSDVPSHVTLYGGRQA
jgi:hypothetical protein